MQLDKCPICSAKLRVKKLECRSCQTNFEGEFYTSPLLGLGADELAFIELFVLASGSLKEMAAIHGVTYPTIRHRLDETITALKAEMKDREDFKDRLLRKVEEGKLSPEKAAQIIKSL